MKEHEKSDLDESDEDSDNDKSNEFDKDQNYILNGFSI